MAEIVFDFGDDGFDVWIRGMVRVIRAVAVSRVLLERYKTRRSAILMAAIVPCTRWELTKMGGSRSAG